ncbi:MAG: YbaN family protein [Bacillota bacterium]|nr:YbaN family protein [Bacillota bacterium]MDW7683121.1 YbaN family protein [Bacillota bacterium]
MEVKKVLFITLGVVSLALGTIGTLLPILPTTPFLLLAFYFFARGSDTWNSWFMQTALYKNHLEPYLQKGGMTVKQKISILLFADVMIAFPFLMTDQPIIRLLLALLVLIKYLYFIFGIKTIKLNGE